MQTNIQEDAELVDEYSPKMDEVGSYLPQRVFHVTSKCRSPSLARKQHSPNSNAEYDSEVSPPPFEGNSVEEPSRQYPAGNNTLDQPFDADEHSTEGRQNDKACPEEVVRIIPKKEPVSFLERVKESVMQRRAGRGRRGKSVTNSSKQLLAVPAHRIVPFADAKRELYRLGLHLPTLESRGKRKSVWSSGYIRIKRSPSSHHSGADSPASMIMRQQKARAEEERMRKRNRIFIDHRRFDINNTFCQ